MKKGNRFEDFKDWLISLGYKVEETRRGFKFYHSKSLDKYMMTVCNKFEELYEEAIVHMNLRTNCGHFFYSEIENENNYPFGVDPRKLGADGLAMIYGLES